jgi:glycosyltransferase involved in cell wall biosynthesis
MRVLLAHNYYQQPGGEDVSFRAEVDLLRQRGHTALCYTQHNDDIESIGRVSLAGKTIWNRTVSRDFAALIQRERPDIVHLHNTFPLLSPTAAIAAHAAGVPVVQTLHNYRLICPRAQLYRDGHICEECMTRSVPWPAIQHRCYRDDRLATSVVVVMTVAHRMLHTWSRSVDRFIALTNDARDRLIAGGLPEEKFVVKPNFLSSDPGIGDGAGGYALFVGRLSPEKGVRALLEAWAQLRLPMTLKIAGSGPLESEVAQAARSDPRIEALGWQTHEEVVALLKNAAVLAFPSEWYECLPHAIIESFAAGTPVICADLGAMRELVSNGDTGLYFTPGDAEGLAKRLEWAHSHPAELASMRVNARHEYERYFTADRNYARLMDIYRSAIDARSSSFS